MTVAVIWPICEKSKMSGLNAEDYIRKIILLEKQVGPRTSYRMLDPFSLDPKDVIGVQTAAKRIAEFIGLHGFTFLVTPLKLNGKVGAHIELKYHEKEVFIEISTDTLKFDEAVLATLSHEITHKYLHVNNISCGRGPLHEYENEVLTDIATVFLGLGKLVLNGCECKNIHQDDRTETLKTGYLGRTQLAFIYRLVCSMRKLPSVEYERGLSPDSINALRESDKYSRDYFDDRFHDSETREKSLNYLTRTISDIQSSLSSLDKNLLYLQSACVKPVETFLEEGHKRLCAIIVKEQETRNKDEYDPCMKFLNTIQFNSTVHNLLLELNDLKSKADQYTNSYIELAKHIQTYDSVFPKPKPDMFTTVICRNDGTKLRLPKDKPHLIAKCPNCKYEFVADTSTPVFGKVRGIRKESIPGKTWKTRQTKKRLLLLVYRPLFILFASWILVVGFSMHHLQMARPTRSFPMHFVDSMVQAVSIAVSITGFPFVASSTVGLSVFHFGVFVWLGVLIVVILSRKLVLSYSCILAFWCSFLLGWMMFFGYFAY